MVTIAWSPVLSSATPLLALCSALIKAITRTCHSIPKQWSQKALACCFSASAIFPGQDFRRIPTLHTIEWKRLPVAIVHSSTAKKKKLYFISFIHAFLHYLWARRSHFLAILNVNKPVACALPPPRAAFVLSLRLPLMKCANYAAQVIMSKLDLIKVYWPPMCCFEGS